MHLRIRQRRASLARKFRFLATVLFVTALPLAAEASRPVDSPFLAVADEDLGRLPVRGGAWEAPLPARYRTFEVDRGALDAALASAPLEGSGASPVELALPYPDGRWVRFRVEESPMLESGLAAKFPEIRTYSARGVEDPSAVGRLSVTALGFHGMLLTTGGTVYIDPWRRWDARHAISYFQRDARRAAGEAMRCEVGGDEDDSVVEGVADGPADPGPGALTPSGATLRTYRLALAATVEYSTKVCLPNPAAVPCAMNAIVTSMNRVNGIYERDVAIRMVLVANNDLVVYVSAPDPYTNNNGGTMLNENVTNLNAVIGSANYDIGHVFSTGGGGVAGLAVVCGASKARGVTGSSNPVGDGFDVDYVAHEIGHQYAGSHTFNGTTSACGGGNRSPSSAYEPGSGTTIMAYAGICGAENLQPHSDDTFHVRSYDQILAFTTAPGHACDVETATGNNPPVVEAGPAFTIPKQTPFTLTGSATDADGDALTYLWEEFDLGTASPPNDDVAAVRPIFRTFVPLTTPSRTFPRMSDVLANVATLGESMSTRNRTMSFRLSVRDNSPGGGGADYDSTTVTVNAAAGPFLVTAPNTAVTWTAGENENVTWEVAGTDAAPVSCAAVAIDLSTDGGATFAFPLAASTANDGSATVAVPDSVTAQARVRVSCVGNVFFDVSNANFTIEGPQGPDVDSLDPAFGLETGGTEVTISGSNFEADTTVTFGGLAATALIFDGPGTLRATTPAHAPGAVDVVVESPGFTAVTVPAGFEYRALLIFADGFLSGDESAWSEVFP